MKETQDKNNLIFELAEVFPDLFLPTPKNYSVKKIKSKRNNVYEVELKKEIVELPSTFVIKHFISGNEEKEVETIRHLFSQSLSVPSILFHKEPYLLLEKIEGENMCDFINLKLKETTRLSDISAKTRYELKSSMKLLASWFAKFHRNNVCELSTLDEYIVLNKGDARLRDFIITPSANQIYGVDFETAYMGNYLEDLSGICCSIIDTDPGIFELSEPHHKITLINTFLKEYHKINSNFISVFNFEIFSELFIKQLNIVKKRRGMKSFHLHRESILDKFYDPTDSLSL